MSYTYVRKHDIHILCNSEAFAAYNLSLHFAGGAAGIRGLYLVLLFSLLIAHLRCAKASAERHGTHTEISPYEGDRRKRAPKIRRQARRRWPAAAAAHTRQKKSRACRRTYLRLLCAQGVQQRWEIARNSQCLARLLLRRACCDGIEVSFLSGRPAGTTFFAIFAIVCVLRASRNHRNCARRLVRAKLSTLPEAGTKRRAGVQVALTLCELMLGLRLLLCRILEFLLACYLLVTPSLLLLLCTLLRQALLVTLCRADLHVLGRVDVIGVQPQRCAT